MSITVNNVIEDKIFISKEKTKETGTFIIIPNTTPVYVIEKLSDNINKYVSLELKEKDRIIIRNNSTQFMYSENGVEYFIVRAGDVLCVVEGDDE